jgi:hypothetical protein
MPSHQKLTLFQRLFNRLFPYRHRGSWFERHLGGHIHFGPVVIYGWNAMHVAINIHVPWRSWGWVCFHPTFRVFGGWWPWYFYISPDATPNSAWFRRGHPSC